jgi:iron complex outermembrane receptor protein
VQFLYEGDDFEALFNLHKRKLNGTARLFRANIIEKGGNSLVENFDRDKVANDGVNFSDLKTWGGSAPAVEPRLGDAALDHRLRNRRIAQPW